MPTLCNVHELSEGFADEDRDLPRCGAGHEPAGVSARELASSFDGVAAAYDRGRPRFAPNVVAAIATAAGGRRVLDVGAGTGRLSGPLLEAGLDMVAVEPLDAMRAILERAIGPQRVLAGHAEDLPLGDGSVEGAVCCDAWHWFDGARAADELQRVVRPGGGVVVCVTHALWQDDDRAPEWAREVEATLAPLWRATEHPYLGGTRRPDGLEGHPGFTAMTLRHERFAHRSDRDGMLAHYASMSAIASLAPPQRAEAVASLEDVLARHGVEEAEIPYRAELWVTRRRRGPARPSGRPAAAS
jgi:SAM-dependent methyltransferase